MNEIWKELYGYNGYCIGKVCLGERKTAGGYHWCFVD